MADAEPEVDAAASAAAAGDADAPRSQNASGGSDGGTGGLDGAAATAASATASAGPAGEGTTVPLTQELIAKSLSLIARTGNGLAHAYTRFELHGAGVTTLDNLEKYPHVRYVDCSDNALVSIDALAGLEYLLAFDAHGNKLKTVSPLLEKKKYLQHVNLAKNQLAEFKIQSWPIAAWLNLNENQLKEVTLEDYPELTHFEARGNKLKDLGKLNTPKLRRLYMAANEITTLTGLETKPELQILHLRGNKLEVLDGLTDKLTNLTYLNLRANRIAAWPEVEKLKVLRALRILSLAENPIDQTEGYRLEVIMRLPKLDKLDKDPISPEEREDALASIAEAQDPAQ
ncbi:hypothetical protein HK105_204314 [Polyrhizophydium stewartii]|uniref:Leucine-rich repeat-containing protein 23 n=1 Tax=Polyrhizophydium stewartii TaxID=2732419 RepID=A0ABR4N9M9_9FUNG